MATPEEESEFHLISVNSRACEDILNSVKKRSRCEEINKKAVSFESRVLPKNSVGEEAEQDGTPGEDGTYAVKIPSLEKIKKNDSLFLRKKKSCIYNETKYNKFVEAFKQQELKKIKKFHHVYKWKVALVILLVLAICFTMIGIFIYYESSHVIEVNIEYDSGDTTKTFSVKHPMKQPVYVYYKISNFYSNFKNFLSDESQALVKDIRCKYIKTFEDIYRYRCVNNIQTLPEVNNDFGVTGLGTNSKTLRSNESCDVNSLSPEQRRRKIFPCGLVSASIFNDKIKLSLNRKIFIIDKFPILNYYDFFSYIKKHKKYASDYRVWINTFSPDYKNWFHPPMTSSFIKPYGVIFEDLQPGDSYKIEFTQNTWPAKHWKAKKSFQLVSLRAVGNSAYELAYSFFLLAIIYLIVIIVMLLLVKSGYYKLGKTFSYCKMSTVNNVTEQTFFRKKSSLKKMAEAAARAAAAEPTRPAKGGAGASQVEPDGKRKKGSSYERVPRAVGSCPQVCLCPLH
ncbi:hypothetical protein AK88_03671 [Plasmodium fragile]|uniref:LEM3/CDC50 family protein n=1 Tax=Plasmodium fragile TaxID=5857 RepID=A0A0D9QI11_PLAFR|nr:uncharacterized protein AK88_03671 [Plasmodium fragile]KJP86664.1 hypothetical protein AK88_03671 [Plasmodium fragile]